MFGRKFISYLVSSLLVFIVLHFISQNVSAVDPNSVPGPKTEVKMLMGRPTFFCDGKPFTSPLASTYEPLPLFFKEMASIGIELYNYQTNCGMNPYGQSKNVWIGPGKWDFNEMDQRSRMILDANPKAMIMPRIFIGTPEWYAEKYPDEMEVMDHGGIFYKEPVSLFLICKNRPYESLASKKWRQDMGESLRMVVEHIQNSDWGSHVFGYQISSLGSEEWYHWNCGTGQLVDYSVHMRKFFSKWLKDKYGSESSLRKSWNDPNITFDTVSIPTKQQRLGDFALTFRNPQKEMQVIDYYQCFNDLIPDTINYFCGVVKQATAGQKVVGAWYFYLLDFLGNPEMGHNSGAGILRRSPNVDFIMQSPPFFDRVLGSGADYNRRPQLSGTLNGKLWYFDNDTPSYLFPKVMEYQIKEKNLAQSNYAKGFSSTKEMLSFMESSMAVPKTAQETIWQWQRNAGMVLAEGIYESFFDLHGGYFDHPMLLGGLRSIHQMIGRGAEHDRSSASQILVVVDEFSQSYLSLPYTLKFESNPRISMALNTFQKAFVHCGAPFDVMLLSDLDRLNPDQYKLVMFQNTFHIDDQSRKLIKEKFFKPGKTVIWCYAPGYFNANTSSDKFMSDLTGINIISSPDETLISPQIVLNQEGKNFLSKYGEKEPNKPVGMDEKICKLFSVKDDKAIVMGTLPGTDIVTMAKKDINGVTNIYTISSVLSPEIVRALAKNAGVHIFNNANDALYANKSYLTINAVQAGNRTIRLPYRSDVYDALTEKLMYPNIDQFDTSLMFGETQIFRYQQRK